MKGGEKIVSPPLLQGKRPWASPDRGSGRLGVRFPSHHYSARPTLKPPAERASQQGRPRQGRPWGRLEERVKIFSQGKPTLRFVLVA